VDLPGATSATLVLTNVQASQEGAYLVVVTDEVGSTPSQTAYLTVLARPAILVQPQSQTVLEGGTAAFSVTVTGTLPMTYRWRRNGVNVTVVTTNATTSTFVLTNVTLAHAGNYTAAISNPAGNAPLSATAVLTVLADFDRDRMADLWEVAYGFDTNSAADALLDRDGDTLINLHEFIAGTHPGDARSYLKVDRLVPGHPVGLWFEAVSNRAYQVEFRDALGSGAWTHLGEVPARPTNRTEVVTDPSPVPRRFYRLVIP